LASGRPIRAAWAALLARRFAAASNARIARRTRLLATAPGWRLY